MAYACPEIIQGENYSEKADLWSLGCVLYHMMALRPPFAGNNPLAVASHIVEGTFEPLGSDLPYSPLLMDAVARLLQPDHVLRPSVQELSTLIAPRLLGSLERSLAREDSLKHRLDFERQRRNQGLGRRRDPHRLLPEASHGEEPVHALQRRSEVASGALGAPLTCRCAAAGGRYGQAHGVPVYHYTASLGRTKNGVREQTRSGSKGLPAIAYPNPTHRQRGSPGSQPEQREEEGGGEDEEGAPPRSSSDRHKGPEDARPRAQPPASSNGVFLSDPWSPGSAPVHLYSTLLLGFNFDGRRQDGVGCPGPTSADLRSYQPNTAARAQAAVR